jgi:hypothetical protein
MQLARSKAEVSEAWMIGVIRSSTGNFWIGRRTGKMRNVPRFLYNNDNLKGKKYKKIY